MTGQTQFLRRREPGEALSVPAADYNAFIEAATFVRAQNKSGSRGQPDAKDGLIYVQNKTGGPLQRFAVVQVGRPLILPEDDNSEAQFLNRIVFEGNTPADEPIYGKFAVTQRACRVDEIVAARINGITPIRLDMYPSDDYPDTVGDWSWCDVTGNVTGHLRTHPGGSAAVIWREDEDSEDDGLRYAAVHLAFRSNAATISGIARGACALNDEGEMEPDEPASAPNIKYRNTLAAVEDGARLLIEWERQPGRFILGPAVCTG